MSELIGSNSTFSQGAIPPDLTVPQDVNEYIKQLRAQLAACEKELPDTWYVDKPLGERLAMLIIQWQKALRINTELEQQLAAAQATIAGYRNTVNIYTEQFQRLESRTARLKEALEDLFKMMDEGLLVRDISHDGQSDWAVRHMKFVHRLKQAQQALAEDK